MSDTELVEEEPEQEASPSPVEEDTTAPEELQLCAAESCREPRIEGSEYCEAHTTRLARQG